MLYTARHSSFEIGLTTETQRNTENEKERKEKPSPKIELNDISGKIVDCAIQVHRKLGPGLLESTYEVCLAHELRKAQLRIETQLSLPITYDDIFIEAGYRIDLLVEDCVVVELKSIERIHPIHEAQLLTYLKLSRKKLGLLINFNVSLLKNGIKRMIN